MSFDPTTRTALSPAELALTVGDTPVRHHHAQAQLNLDILAHVAKYQPCGFVELYDLFGANQDDGKNAMERFRARLGHLTHTGQLVASGTAGARRWRMPIAGTELQSCHPQQPEPAWVGTVVRAHANDAMHGPVYVPPPGPALRPGALDHKRVPTVGLRC